MTDEQEQRILREIRRGEDGCLSLVGWILVISLLTQILSKL